MLLKILVIVKHAVSEMWRLKVCHVWFNRCKI